MLGFVFRIQHLAQFIEVEIGYLVAALPMQINSCHAFVRVPTFMPLIAALKWPGRN